MKLHKFKKIFIEEKQVKDRDFYDHFKSQLICVIDKSLPVDPLMCSGCEASFCSECITDWLKINSKCPNNCSKFEIKNCNRATKQIQEGIMIVCDCGNESNLLDYPKHCISECLLKEVNCWVCNSLVNRKLLIETEQSYKNNKNKLDLNKYIFKNYAFDLAKMGNYHEAINILNKSLEIDPEYETAYLYLGKIYLDLNEHLKGLKLLFKSLEIDSFLLHPKYIIMNFEYKNKELFKKYLTYLQQDKHNKESLFYLGLIHSMKNEYLTAEEYFFKSIEIDPKYSQAYIGLSLLRKLQNKYEEANKTIETAIKIDCEKNKYYLKNYAWLLVNQRRYEDALKYHKKITKMDPNFASGILNYGHSKCEQDIDDEAMKSFKKATLIDGYYFLAYSNIAVIEIKKGRVYDAKKIYYNLLEKDPDFIPANSQLGNLLFNEDKFEEAIPYYLKCLEFEPYNVDRYIDLGDCYQNLENWYEAIKVYKLGLEIKQDDIKIKNLIKFCEIKEEKLNLVITSNTK